MRMSDWSSDVCASDLRYPRDPRRRLAGGADTGRISRSPGRDYRPGRTEDGDQRAPLRRTRVHGRFRGLHGTGMAQERQSVVYGKRMSVRVNLGGHRIIKKKNIRRIEK